MTPAPDAGHPQRDLEAPDADAFEQSAAVEVEDDDDASVLPPAASDLEAPEADALEQSLPAPLDDDDRR